MKNKHIGSVILAVTGFLSTVIQFWPDAMLQAWLFLPDELKASLPPIAVKWVTYSIFTASMLSKLYKSWAEKKKLKEELENVRTTNAVLAGDTDSAGGDSGSSGIRAPEEKAGAARGESEVG